MNLTQSGILTQLYYIHPATSSSANFFFFLLYFKRDLSIKVAAAHLDFVVMVTTVKVEFCVSIFVLFECFLQYI